MRVQRKQGPNPVHYQIRPMLSRSPSAPCPVKANRGKKAVEGNGPQGVRWTPAYDVAQIGELQIRQDLCDGLNAQLEQDLF
eukprot:10189208-Alexandrium_andersonii.AAC.1